MSDDDDYTWLDHAQDLGAWLLVFGAVPLLLVVVIGYALGVW